MAAAPGSAPRQGSQRPGTPPPSPAPGERSLLFDVGRLQAVDQLVQGGLDLVGIASHQHSVLERVGAEALDLADVLIEYFDLFEARHRLAVGLPPDRRLRGIRTHCLLTLP